MKYAPGAFPETAILGPGGGYALDPDLPIGTWHVMANGRIYHLKISKVSGGRVAAELNSGTFKDGYYDAASGEFTFTRELPDGTPQYWSGWLMYHVTNKPHDPAHRMAGTIFQPNLAPNTRNGGWYATIARE